MAVTYFTGFEAQAAGADGVTLSGTAAYSAVQARTGVASIRCNPASGAGGSIALGGTISGWIHFGLYIVTMPTVNRRISVVRTISTDLFLMTTGKLRIGVDSTTTLTTGVWYWVGMRAVAGAFNGVYLQIDGVDQPTHSMTTTLTTTTLGPAGTEASALDLYIDDVIVDNTGFIAPSKVNNLVPTADSAIGTGWTLGSGGTSNLFGGVDNQPPTAVADVGTTNQIRNATANANSNYDATLQTYTVGGVGGSDTLLAVQNVIATAAPVTTSSKQGTVGNVSNPAITNIALGAGGTAGAFWSGVAGGTYPTGWKVSTGTLTTSPSVTVGTAPVMRVTQVTSSTRIAMVSYMALRVAWTPVSGSASVTPTTAALVATGFAPTVTASDHQLVMVPTAGGAGYAATVLADSPVGYWRLGESSGNPQDSSGNANHVTTVIGTPTYGVTGALSGDPNTAVTLDGASTDAFAVPDHATLDVGDVVSLEAWLKGTGSWAGDNHIIVAKFTNAFAFRIVGATGILNFRKANVGSIVDSTISVAATGWHHVVATKDGVDVHLYIDGVERTGTVTSQTLASNTSVLRIGSFDAVSDSFFAGTLDEVAVYGTALSAARVLAHYNAGITAGLVLATFAPTVTVAAVADPQLVTPTTATLTATKYAPTVTTTDNQLVTPTTKATILATFAPTVTATDHQAVTPTTKALTLTTFAPSVNTPELATPSTVSLALTTFAPSISVTDNQAVTPTTKALALATFAPTVTATDPQLVTPTTTAVTLTTFAPTVTAAAHQQVTPSTVALILQAFAPAVTATDHQAVTPTTKALTLATFAPIVSTPQTVTPALVSLALTTFAPVVSNPDPQLVTPTTKALTLATFAPSVGVSDAASIVPPNAALSLTTYAPTVIQPDPQLVTPTTPALELHTFEPVVTATVHQAVIPTTAALVTTRHIPTVAATANQSATPATKALALTAYAPQVTVNNIVATVTIGLTLTTFAPSVTAGTNTYAFPDPASLELTGYAPFIDLSAFKLVTPATAVLVVTTYPPTAEQHSITPLPTPIYGFAVVASGPGAGVGSAKGGATVTTSEGGSTAVSSSGPSARVTIR